MKKIIIKDCYKFHNLKMILIVERIENIIDQDNNREGRTKLKNVD